MTKQSEERKERYKRKAFWRMKNDDTKAGGHRLKMVKFVREINCNQYVL